MADGRQVIYRSNRVDGLIQWARQRRILARGSRMRRILFCTADQHHSMVSGGRPGSRIGQGWVEKPKVV